MMDALLQWTPALIVILLALAFCVRRTGSGLGTLEKFKGRHFEHIHSLEQRILEDKKNISSTEHLELAQVPLVDLLRLEGNRPGFRLDVQGSSLLLHTPEDVWRITLNMREKTLQHTRKILHGKTSWLLESTHLKGEYADLAELMRNLTAYLHGKEIGDTMPQIPSRRVRPDRYLLQNTAQPDLRHSRLCLGHAAQDKYHCPHENRTYAQGREQYAAHEHEHGKALTGEQGRSLSTPSAHRQEGSWD